MLLTQDQQIIADRLWNNYQLFLLKDSGFNNKVYPQSQDFYTLQNILINTSPEITMPIIDFYISYIDQDPRLGIYFLYSPFIWVNPIFRFQLSKLLHKLYTFDDCFIINKEYDDYFLNFLYYQTPRIDISKGTGNTLNLWCYLLSLHLIPAEGIPALLHIDISDNLAANIVDLIIDTSRIPINEIDDWFDMNDCIVSLCSRIYHMSTNRELSVNYHSLFFSIFKSTLIKLKEYKTFQAYLMQSNQEMINDAKISRQEYESYRNLFINSNFNIPETWYAGAIILCKLCEDIIDYFLSHIPDIYRSKEYYPFVDINDFIKIFKYIYGVNDNELYTITDS